jgi:amidase
MPEPSTSPQVSQTLGGSGLDPDTATVAALRQALTEGTITAGELTAFYLTRIERLNPVLGAVITVSPDAAADARASDEARAGGVAPGPLDGIPVLIKDNIAARGMPATAGSPALAEADQDEAFLVTRLREAGAVILGKANLSEWANFRSSHPSSGWSTLGGQAVNPHGPGRNPSGSSSGSGVAVAAGLAPIAVGTETDGSILCPASACGIVGIKPTLGLVSRSGIVPISLAQDTAGPMTRSVADAAALLSVLAAADPADPATAPAAVRARDYTTFLDPSALAGARLGVWRDPAKNAGARTTAVLDQAVAVLREAGAELVDPVGLPGAAEITEPEFAALTHEFKHDLNAYLAGLRGPHPADLAELIKFNLQNADTVLVHFGQEVFERAEATTGDLGEPGYRAARAEASRRAGEALDGLLAVHRLDAIVALTANPAWLTDYVLGDHDHFHTSGPSAVAGYPAVSVMAGNVAGLPVGLSFLGPAWSEPALIALAYAFEQRAPARLIPDLRGHRPGGAPAGRR